MPNPQRKWTAEEDDMIRNSGLSLWKLEQTLRANTETIRLRAQQLGIEIAPRAHNKTPRKLNSIRVPRKDPLLTRLRMFHVRKDA
jgi:hypothetical protein